jgi:hypothetical protein
MRFAPPICPLSQSPYNYSNGADLIAKARNVTRAWIDGGGLDCGDFPDQLATHTHACGSAQSRCRLGNSASQYLAQAVVLRIASGARRPKGISAALAPSLFIALGNKSGEWPVKRAGAKA